MKDHRIEFYLDAVTYLALRSWAESQDRTISQQIRYLVRSGIEASMSSEQAPKASRDEGGSEGEA